MKKLGIFIFVIAVLLMGCDKEILITDQTKFHITNKKHDRSGRTLYVMRAINRNLSFKLISNRSYLFEVGDTLKFIDKTNTNKPWDRIK